MKLFSSRALQNSKRDDTTIEEPKQQHQQLSILDANTASATGNDDFVSLGCSKWIQTVCETVGIKTPTPIQRLAIGPFIKGISSYSPFLIRNSPSTLQGKTLLAVLRLVVAKLQRLPSPYCTVLRATRLGFTRSC